MMVSRFIIVNYHYIRPERIRGLYPCTEENFQKQIAYLLDRYTIVPLKKIYEYAHDRKEGQFCAFTFDDGLLEHYEFVLPIFNTKGIVGSFFPIGMTLQEERVSHTHKLHLVLWKMEILEIVRIFHEFFRGAYHISDKERINSKRRFDDVLTSNLKETLIHLTPQERTSFIDDVFQKIGKNERAVAEELFMRQKEVKELHDAGMDVGLHGYRHLPFDSLDAAEQKKDIDAAIQTMEAILGRRPTTLSYPNGRYNQNALSLLRERNIQTAVVLGAADVTASFDPLLLPRYDTNDVFSL